MRGIRGEAAFVVEGFGDAPDQRVERGAQRHDFAWQRSGFVERCQRLGIECADLTRHRIHRPQCPADDPPYGERHQRQRQHRRQQQRQPDLARQPLASGVGLADHHAIFRVVVLHRIKTPAFPLMRLFAEACRHGRLESGVAGRRHQTLCPAVLGMPDFKCDRHRIAPGVLVQFLHEMFDLAAGHDRQQRLAHLRQLAVEQLVRFVVGTLVDDQHGQQPDRRHGAGQQPDQPAAQRVGRGLAHAAGAAADAM